MALDYNPDKEAHRDHKYIVVKATKSPDFKGVNTSKGYIPFKNKEQAFYVKDKTLANEIRQTVGVDATVSRVTNDKPADRGHTYFFGQMPEMPWKRIAREEAERLLKEKEEEPCQEQPDSQDLPSKSQAQP